MIILSSDPRKLGDLLMQLRGQASLTQMEVATSSKMHPSMLSRAENARASPTLQTLIAILAATGHQLAVVPIKDEQ
jgi:transcriptional regulator with XRE-family HTH domain